MVGEKRTVKVVEPEGCTGVVGLVVTAKFAASAPSIVTPRPVSGPVPEFRMVNTRLEFSPVVTEPNAEVETPSVKPVPAGCSTAISGMAR